LISSAFYSSNELKIFIGFFIVGFFQTTLKGKDTVQSELFESLLLSEP